MRYFICSFSHLQYRLISNNYLVILYANSLFVKLFLGNATTTCNEENLYFRKTLFFNVSASLQYSNVGFQGVTRARKELLFNVLYTQLEMNTII